MSDIEADLADTTEATIRVPRNLYGHIRASYDSRDKILDWCLAIGVTAVLAWAYRDELRGWVMPDTSSLNVGRDDPPQPSQDVDSAFPYGGRSIDRVYTYNMPSSRAFKRYPGPSGIRPPADPSAPPSYDAEDQS